MHYLIFIILFVFFHLTSYTLAGALSLKMSKDIYESKQRHCDFLRDMSDKEESRHVTVYFLPAQIIRGLLMSLVLVPLLPAIIQLSLLMRLLFFGGMMFIFTHFAAASPFPDNLEGLVYFKQRYIGKKFF